MGYIGRKLRHRRLDFSNSTVGLIVPIDHGVTVGPIPGLESLSDIGRWIGNESISAIVAHKGMLERLVTRDMLSSTTGVILHLNGMPGMSKDADSKQMVSNVRAALSLGADAVSVQVNFTADNVGHNMSLLGAVTDATHAAGLPLLTMVYDKVKTSGNEKLDRMHGLIRLAAELGTDCIKIGFPDSLDHMRELIAPHCDQVSMYFAGGEKMDEERLLEWTRVAVQSGASGLCAGRNVFQHPQPDSILRRLAECVRQEALGRTLGQPFLRAA